MIRKVHLTEEQKQDEICRLRAVLATERMLLTVTRNAEDVRYSHSRIAGLTDKLRRLGVAVPGA